MKRERLVHALIVCSNERAESNRRLYLIADCASRSRDAGRCMLLVHASVTRWRTAYWRVAPLHAVCSRAASHDEERDCDRRATLIAAPMTAAPMTVPRILSVPRYRTRVSAAHGEISLISLQVHTRRGMSSHITSMHTITCSGITESTRSHALQDRRVAHQKSVLPRAAFCTSVHSSCLYCIS